MSLHEPLASASRPDEFAETARILETFEALARNVGPRNVGMAPLAAELGISTKTLYRHFAGKSQLVTALIRYRATGWKTQREMQLAVNMPAVQRIYRLAASWVHYLASFSPDFWQQLARDFPEADRIVRDEYEAFLREGAGRLSGIVREDLDPAMALHALRLLIEHAARRGYCAKLGLPADVVLRQHIELWARGAVRPDEFVSLEDVS